MTLNIDNQKAQAQLHLLIRQSTLEWYLTTPIHYCIANSYFKYLKCDPHITIAKDKFIEENNWNPNMKKERKNLRADVEICKCCSFWNWAILSKPCQKLNQFMENTDEELCIYWCVPSFVSDSNSLHCWQSLSILKTYYIVVKNKTWNMAQIQPWFWKNIYILKKKKESSAYDAELQSKTSSVKIHALSALNHRRKFENYHVQRVTLEKKSIFGKTLFGSLLEQMNC